MKPKYICYMALFLTVFILAGRFDLPISLYLTSNGPKLLGLIGERIAPLPAFLITGACAVSLRAANKKNGWYIVVLVAVSLWGGFQTMGFHKDPVSVLLCLLTGGVLYFCMNRLGGKMDSRQERVRRICELGLYATVFAFFTVSVLKVIWGRPRFLSLSDPLTQFVPWYQLHGPVLLEDLHKSFPSGHTVTASSILWISVLPYAYEKTEKNRSLLVCAAWIWILLSALSRIIAGKHFSTDVSAAIGIYCLVFLVLKNKLLVDVKS